MSTFTPPTPVLIGGGGAGGGSTLTTTDSSVILTSSETNGTSSVIISAGSSPGIVVDSDQNVLIGADATTSNYRLVVVTPNQYALELNNAPNETSAYFAVSSTGVLSITTSGNDLNLASNQVRLGNNSLYLGGAQVLASAAEINYLTVTKGTATADKAMVLNTSSSISGINSLSATTLVGTLSTASQPNINQLNTINITTSLSLGGVLISSTAPELNYVHVTPGTTEATRALIVDSAKSIAGINSLTATTLTGTLQTAAQTNITSVGTLSTLKVSGQLGVGTTTPSTDIEIFNASNPILKLNNGSTASNITIDINGNLRLNSDGDVTIQSNRSLRLNGTGEVTGATLVSATTLAGTLTTANQTNITSIGELTDLVVTNSIGLGISVPNKKMEILDTGGDCLRISKSAEVFADITINLSGDLLLGPSAGVVRLLTGTSLRLSSGDISGVASLTATNLSGTIQTAAQPNITSIGTLTNLTISNNLNIVHVLATDLTGTILTTAQPNITSIGTLTNLTITNTLTVGTVSATNLSGTIQTAAQPNITSIGTLTNLTLSNNLNVAHVLATDLTGTILTVAQPNITSIGILTNLTISSTLTVATVSATNLSGTIQTASQTNITAIGTLNTLSVTNGITCASVSATDLTGTIQTAAQPNITSVGVLSSLSVTNGISGASLTATSITGTLQTASQPNVRTLGVLTNVYTSGKIGVGITEPTYDLDIASADGNAINIGFNENVISISASATGDMVVTTNSQRLTLANSTSLRFTGTGGITGLASFSATDITGTLQTASQPNITSLGFLNNLGTTSLQVGTDHVATYNISVNNLDGKFISLTDGTVIVTERIIEGEYVINCSTGRINLSTNVDLALNGGTITGLTTVTVGGQTVTGSQLALLSEIIIGTVAANSLFAADDNLDLSGFNNLSATNLFGTIQTVAQPNITSVGTLTSLALAGALSGVTTIGASGIVTLTNNTSSSSTTTGALVVTGGVGVGGTLTATNLAGQLITAAQTAITSVGTLSSLTLAGALSGATTIGASGIVTLTNNTSSTSTTTGALVVTGGVGISGTLTVGTFAPNSLSLSGSITGATTIDASGIVTLTNETSSTSTTTGALVVTGGVGIGGTLTVGTFAPSSLSLSGSITGATTIDASGIVTLTNNTSSSSTTTGALVVTGGVGVGGTLTATTLAGTLSTAAQTNITSVGNLSSLNVAGNVGIGTQTPSKQLEINSLTGDCLRLSYDQATNTLNYATLVVSSAGNLTIVASGGTTTIAKLATTSLALGNTANTDMPLEIGYTPFTMTAAYAYNTSGNSHGTIAAGGTTSYNYSIRALGRILCTQSVDVTSDRRVKTNIRELSDDYCTKFVEETTPVSFNLIDGDDSCSYGYIAQDLLRHGFDDLVNMAVDAKMQQEVDLDGLISPQGIKFTISYEHIIPILAKNQKRLMDENKELSETVAKLLEMVQQLMK